MISNHIFVFFYNFSVFMGLLSIGLAFIYRLRIKDRNTTPKQLLIYMVLFFLYGFINLLGYYNHSILTNLDASILLPLTANFLYIFMYFFWIKYLAIQIKPLDRRKFKSIFYIVVFACCILWAAETLWFMDVRLNVLVFSGALITVITDVLFYTMIVYSVITGINNRTSFSSRQQKCFALFQSITLLLYASYMLFKDFLIAFANYTVDLWYGNNIGFCAILSFIINTCFIIYFSMRIKERFTVIDEFETIVHHKTSNIEQIASEYSLSERETDVLRLIFDGKTNLEISDSLFISTNTVKKHINALLKKMNLHNRVDIITKYK